MPLFTRKAEASATNKLSLRELVLFSVLGAIMFLSKIAMEWAPNIHFLGMFIATFTLVYRKKALIPLYVFILIEGVVAGFSAWWLPYLYIWLPLWAVFMAVGKLRIPPKWQLPLYMLLCGLHGLAYGTLYAPAQALLFGLSFKTMLAWIVAGLPFDFLHGIGNLAAGILILPLAVLLRKLDKTTLQSKMK